jgi:hypothetical protein
LSALFLSFARFEPMTEVVRIFDFSKRCGLVGSPASC